MGTCAFWLGGRTHSTFKNRGATISPGRACPAPPCLPPPPLWPAAAGPAACGDGACCAKAMELQSIPITTRKHAVDFLETHRGINVLPFSIDRSRFRGVYIKFDLRTMM